MTTALGTELDAPHEWGFEPGDRITHDLTALKLLGGGHRYEAYLAHDERLLTSVVVKILRPHRVADTNAVEGLAEEVSALRTVQHPSIARAFDAVLDGPRPHIVLEHVEGPRLSTLIRKYGRLDVEQLIALGVQVAAALHHLHRKDLLHLDVKPSNIIMSGPPKLIDLSVSLTITAAASLRSRVGTDAYMAPEQMVPGHGAVIGPAADVWGLGATLYEAASGKRAFPDPDEGRDASAHRAVPPAALGRAVPGRVAEVILATLAHDPGARPTAMDVVEALEPLMVLPRRIVLGRMRPRWS